MPGSDLNLLQYFWDQVHKGRDRTAVVQRRAERWTPSSWTEIGRKVARLSSALSRLGLAPGERMAIFSDNCEEWILADYAGMSAGLVSVPIYPNQTEEQLRYILEHSEAKVIVVRGEARLKRLGSPAAEVRKVLVIDAPAEGDDRFIGFHDFLEQGSPETAPHVEFANRIDPGSLATISYTSGTTAHPKGVMLSHGNITAQMTALRPRATRVAGDRVLSYLPLSHITERLSQFRHADTGFTIYFGGGIDAVAEDLKHVRPTAFMGVPRVYEKFQEAILARVSQAPAGRRALFEKTIAAGYACVDERERFGRASLRTRFRSAILQRLVGRKIRQALGLDQARRFFSGAAPLNPETARFFYALGMPIAEGYGMTECAGACNLNFGDRPVFGTVGPHLDGFDFRIAADGEILIRSGSVFVGYFKDPETTSEVIRDGWLHTGDIGSLDAGGNLRITDRKKSILVTSAGKNVAPAPIEALLKKHPKISQAVVVGDKRKYLTALLALAPGHSPAQCRSEVQAHVERVNSTLASYETIKDFRILENEFTVESGELTPTLKVKRGYIQEKYRSLIDGMYETAASAAVSRP